MVSANNLLAHREKWKQQLVDQAKKTIADRIAREKHLKKNEGAEGK